MNSLISGIVATTGKKYHNAENKGQIVNFYDADTYPTLRSATKYGAMYSISVGHETHPLTIVSIVRAAVQVFGINPENITVVIDGLAYNAN